ncbi:tRNA guanosine(34) transglycosylase Tgt [Patescibacteria group bacterium]|nr:tRNA guanosine(34) transglycosylase Tgt [Patescibacteria group bacterium]
MIEFKIIKSSKKSKARLGILKTENGEIKTPSLVPVATQAVVKTLTSEEVLETKTQVLICNTFHLHLRAVSNLHKFMNWPKPLMSDSGGFQVFCLGFGQDHNVGKILKSKGNKTISHGQQPKSLKITDRGVFFKSPIDGRQLFLGPKESIRRQEALGADIIFTFDECTSSLADKEYTEKSLEKTHNWAEQCLQLKKTKQALYGIVQGGKYEDLRQKSAKTIGSMDFDGFGIGGEFGDDKRKLGKTLAIVNNELPYQKPRHLLGIGYPEDIKLIVAQGIDTFDCTVPTHYARRGIAFTPEGRLNLNQMKYSKDKKPIDRDCRCSVCKNYSRNYITHLLRAKEITALRLLTFHNLYYFNTLVEKIREDIENDKL